ncbi:hypothetical protein SLA2020_199290 [Shorea laevis]
MVNSYDLLLNLIRNPGFDVLTCEITANEAFQKVVTYGLVNNMVIFLTKDYHMTAAKADNVIFSWKPAKANNTIFFWNAATSFEPLLGAFFSDSYLGRFLTIGIGSLSSLLV